MIFKRNLLEQDVEQVMMKINTFIKFYNFHIDRGLKCKQNGNLLKIQGLMKN